MKASHPPQRLRGLDPTGVLGVLGGSTAAECPVIPGWEIEGIAGRGGLGVVWRARREGDGRKAAIKVAAADDPDTVERIEEEAAALAALEHPHIVGLIGSGPLDDGGLYLAMEYVDGPPLAQIIPAGGLPPGESYAHFRHIAEAVICAHGQGILHRDLKPGNVLMPERDGRLHPLVADFGLARPVARRVQHLSLTHAGLIAGTAEYLPPEAYRADYQPHKGADIYALGVILYEMLTGHPPRGAWVPVSQQRRTDIRVDDVIRRALHPDPEQRWPDVKSMLAALGEINASAPRYAGAPRLTLPVRAADCLWTLLGLLVFYAACSTLIRLGKGRVSWPLDLIGEHSLAIGGFNALHHLLLATVPLSLWQLARLWRFRRVPLREALPGPLGLKLGTSRTAAALAAAAQLLCLVLPAHFLLHMHMDTNRPWLRPGDPPWLHGLVVTPREKSAIHPLWQRGEPGVAYWLRESYGPPEHPLSRQIDRTDIFPGTTPALMLSTGTLLGLTILLTAGIAATQWWTRQKKRRAVLLALLLALYGTVAFRYHDEQLRAVAFHRDPVRSRAWAEDAMTQHLQRLAPRLLAATVLTPEELALYADTVQYRDHGPIPRAAIPFLRATAATATSGLPTTELLHVHSSWEPGKQTFRLRRHILEFTGPPAAADLVTIEIQGTLTLDGATVIKKESLQRTPLYTAEPRTLTQNGAAAWAAAFLHAHTLAASGDTTALTALLHPSQLTWDAKRKPAVATQIATASEHCSAAARQHPRPAAAGAVKISGPQPGGRTRIAIPMRDAGYLEADLIFTASRWQCVRLQFGGD